MSSETAATALTNILEWHNLHLQLVFYHTQPPRESTYAKKCTEDTAGDPSKTYHLPLKIEHNQQSQCLRHFPPKRSFVFMLACYPQKNYREAELTKNP